MRQSILILAAVTLVTAWFSETFYFPDEHYQILEFMAFKLGITQPAELPWEFSVRIRPWFQPLVYFLIAKPAMLAGVKDMFVIAFILRLATGLFSLLALAAFARAILASSSATPMAMTLRVGLIMSFSSSGMRPHIVTSRSLSALASDTRPSPANASPRAYR